MEVKKVIALDNIEYYHTHLYIVNCILPKSATMTPKEIELLGMFMSLKGDVATYRFGPTAKKVVMAELNLSAQGMSNHLKSLKDKGLLYWMGDILTIRDMLFPETTEQLYRIRLVNKSNIIQNETTT